MIKNLLTVLLFLPSVLIGEQNADFFRSSGKIHVVYGVITIIFLGLITFLVRLDIKIKKLENK